MGLWLGVLAGAFALFTAVAAPARSVRLFHGTAAGGQYLNLSLFDSEVNITAARLDEHCHPGGRRQLVKPNALALDPIAVGDNGRFAKTVRKDGHWTRYRGYVNVTTVVVKVIDSADTLCKGGKQRFITRLMK